MRTKKVFPTCEIAHLWANKSVPEARNPQDNFYFDNHNEIYSYGQHFLIAKRFAQKNGKKLILLTNKTFSNTTAGHVAAVKYAISHLDYVICPDNIRGPENMEMHINNIRYFENEIAELLTKYCRVKKPNMALYYKREIDTIKKYLDKYLDFFKLKSKSKIKTIFNRIKKDLEKFNSAKEKVKPEDFILSDNFINKAKKEKEYALKKVKEALKKFYTHQARSIQNGDNIFLRISKDKKAIETSRGASMGLRGALKLFNFVTECVKKKEKIKINLSEKFENYNLDYIHENGDIKIGCHFIKYKEMQRIFPEAVETLKNRMFEKSKKEQENYEEIKTIL